jgi:hypothetical protein
MRVQTRENGLPILPKRMNRENDGHWEAELAGGCTHAHALDVFGRYCGRACRRSALGTRRGLGSRVRAACTIVTAAEALRQLRGGHARFVPIPPLPGGCNRMIHRHQSPEDWHAHAGDRQCPFAVIVGCTDSRVSPEVVFDQGIGVCSIAGSTGR